MNCEEFGKQLQEADLSHPSLSSGMEAHRRDCAACASLSGDFAGIRRQASLLPDAEPSRAGVAANPSAVEAGGLDPSPRAPAAFPGGEARVVPASADGLGIRGHVPGGTRRGLFVQYRHDFPGFPPGASNHRGAGSWPSRAPLCCRLRLGATSPYWN